MARRCPAGSGLKRAKHADRHYLQLAVELSRGYRDDVRRWPFGAIVVSGGKIAGRGINQVVELHDPTAHAEVMALRAAGETLAAHQSEDTVLYSSSEPCPMCLAACYWASVPRVVYAATVFDTAGNGVRDLAIYDELRLPAERRSLRQDASGGDLHDEAVAVLQDWHEQFRPAAPGQGGIHDKS
jgi:tRNA(Arg) A34 adenosine deaminase TadA